MTSERFPAVSPKAMRNREELPALDVCFGPFFEHETGDTASNQGGYGLVPGSSHQAMFRFVR